MSAPHREVTDQNNVIVGAHREVHVATAKQMQEKVKLTPEVGFSCDNIAIGGTKKEDLKGLRTSTSTITLSLYILRVKKLSLSNCRMNSLNSRLSTPRRQ